MKRKPFVAVASCLFVFVSLGFSAKGQYREDPEIERLEKETTEKILCEPFDEKLYPPKFLEIVKQIEENLKENGGVAVVGRVRYKDGSRVKPGDLTFYLGGLPYPHGCGSVSNCYPFEDGWFTSYNIKPGPSHKQGLDEAEAKGRPMGMRLTVFTLDSSPMTAIFRIKQGKIIYLDFELEKLPPEKQITVSGTVRDETGSLLRDTPVTLFLVGGSSGRQTEKRTTTDANGQFVFDGLAPNHYYVSASKRGLEADGTLVSPPKEETERTIFVSDLILCKPRKIVFDFVYQPDGSRDFTRGNLKPKTVEWSPYSGISFKEGKVGRDQERDLDLFVKRENLFFGNTWVTSGNGIYDAGEVPFDSVTEAKDGSKHYRPDGRTQEIPVKKNHVYVVRTYTGEYAKLIVRDIVTIEPENETSR